MNKPVSRQSNLVVQDLENELLIYDLKIDKALCLNQTSALVWQLCNGNNSMADISHLMSRKLNTLVSQDFVWLALDGLRKEKLLENETDLENHPAGLSRREVVKKVGLASMVALPIISSLVAPSAAMAQSGCIAPHSVCTQADECCSPAMTAQANACICCVTAADQAPGTLFCDSLNTNCANASEVCCSGSGSIDIDQTLCGSGDQCICDPHP